MPVHTIKAVQIIPATIEEVWAMFSDPGNLKDITPADMNFKVISKHHGDSIYPGQIIEYTVRPLFGIPMYWMTEITQVSDKKFFIDEQRKGPYAMWHHQHHFKEVDGGVEMTDIVHYRVPGWWLGKILNSMLIRNKLLQIFRYRYEKVTEKFGSWKDQQPNVVIS